MNVRIVHVVIVEFQCGGCAYNVIIDEDNPSIKAVNM